MAAIVFTEDFATKSKGEEWECDGMLASQLVNVDKVARYKEEGEKVPKFKPSQQAQQVQQAQEAEEAPEEPNQ